MKKCLLIVLSSLVCLFSYSTNVPKVNNHGFPQNLKTSPKEVVIESVEKSQTQEEAIIAPVEKTKSLKKNVINSPKNKVIVKEEEKVIENNKINISKKEVRKTLKDLKKPQNKEGNGIALSIIAFLLSLFFPILGLILGYVAKASEGANALNVLAIIFGWIVIILCLFLILLFVAMA